MNPDSHDLIQRHISRLLTDDEAAVLQTRLKADPDLRRLYLHYMNLDVALEAQAGSRDRMIDLLRIAPLTENKAAGRWFSWRPLAAAAAGIVLGMFCTSVVFGYIVPAFKSPVSLLEESFEQISSPAAAGVPTRPGSWSGDFAEIVGQQNGIAPHSGAEMWRFLRADNAVGAQAPANYVGEAIHVLDLKPLRSAGVKPGSQIEISAWFAQGETLPESRYHWNIKAAAFEGPMSDAPKLWEKWDEASVCLGGREVPAERSEHWQRVSLTMQVPANANILVFECAVVQRQPGLTAGVAEFPAHYLDDVRVRILPMPHDTQPLE